MLFRSGVFPSDYGCSRSPCDGVSDVKADDADFRLGKCTVVCRLSDCDGGSVCSDLFYRVPGYVGELLPAGVSVRMRQGPAKRYT